MNLEIRRLTGALALLVAAIATVSLTHAETCSLVPKKVDAIRSNSRSAPPDWMFRITHPQIITMQTSTKVVVEDGKSRAVTEERKDSPLRREFDKLVTQEPKKYNSELPFRGVVKLGDKKYAFVLDAFKPKASGYALLYFDRNGNGDLTDDGLVENEAVEKYRKALEKQQAEKEKAEKQKPDAGKEKSEKAEKTGKKPPAVSGRIVLRGRRITSPVFPTGGQFPQVDMEIEVGGKKTAYAFSLSAYAYSSRPMARFSSALYREGEIELDGEKHRVVLVDYNSNGRFDDATTVVKRKVSSDGPELMYTNAGDHLFIDPKNNQNYRLVYDATGPDFCYNVGKLLYLNGGYYNLTVSPDGEQVALEPSEVEVGYVTNPAKHYAAMVNGPQGVLKIRGVADEKVPLPVGNWRLLSYVIDLTEAMSGVEPGAEDDKADAEEEPKTDGRPPAPKYTYVTAMATTATRPIDVVLGESAALPFGAPYYATVDPGYYNQRADTLNLGLEILGSVDEVVTYMEIDGKRPPKPTFKILGPGDKVAAEGDFEYG